MTESDTRSPDWLWSIKGYILDMDGVLYRGDSPIPEAPHLLSAFDAAGIPFNMATNNSTNTPEAYVSKLASMGMTVTADRIVTSALATKTYLQSTYTEGSKAYVVGMDALREAVFGDGYFVEADESVDVVISGADFELTYESLRVACLCIRGGADYVATNGDTTFPTEVGLVPGAGSIVAALVAATDVEPTVVGKPSPVMVESCVNMLGLNATDVVMIGDRLDTDILAGNEAGTKTILVTTGISQQADIESTGIKPDLVISSLDSLSDVVEQAQTRSR